tara:strand:- start:205 stop:552 length:348 start_codon:yes stop_codon:yes gene_type:complete
MKGFPKLEGVDLTKKPTKPSIAYQKSNEQDNKELDAKEDAMAVDNPTKPKKKVMVDGAATKGFNTRNGAKSDVQKKVISEKKKFDAMSDAEKAALQESRNQRKRDFDKERAKKGK